MEKLKLIDKLLSPGGLVERICLDELNNAKVKILKQYDRTAINVKKSDYRTEKYGAKGRLRKALSDANTSIFWQNGDLIGRISIRNAPDYIRTQELGFRAREYTWRQKFVIVGYRKEPSKRGDYHILGNIRKNELVPKHLKPYIMTITHLVGMQGRLFLHEGRIYLRGTGGKRIVRRLARVINES
jgi:hypothetical protein